MRIALRHTGEVGVRAGRILLGERRLELLGLIDRSPSRKNGDDRVVRADDLSDYDTLVTDRLHGFEEDIRMAANAGIRCVLWADEEDPGDNVVAGANLASGIAAALAVQEVSHEGSPLSVRIAWTEPGTPLRGGEAVPFPDPVGARWGNESGLMVDLPFRAKGVVAPVTGQWAGAMAEVTTATPSGVSRRVVGVADLAAHLEALALAAAAIESADGHYAADEHHAWNSPGFLASALGAGLTVAAHTME